MEKAYRGVLAILGRVLLIGFSIQIVLGICWMICNFTGFQRFGESILYEEISKTLICDEYEGILYPVLIMITGGIEKLILIPYRYIIYLLQIGFAFFASCKLLQSIGIERKLWKIWGSLVMLTLPMAMQCHLAILPDSMVSSALIAEIAFSLVIFRSGQQLWAKDYVKALVCWLIAALLQPEYLYIGMVPVLCLFLYGFVKAWKTDKKRIIYNGILIAAFAGMILGVTDLAREEGYYGRVHKSFNASMASRCAWLFSAYDAEYWPGDIKNIINTEQAREIDYYADNMDRILGRKLEEAVGEERAREILGEIAACEWRDRKGQILRYTVWDIVGYTLSPVMIQVQFAGEGYDAYSGRNYDIMRERTPVLSSYYMNYGCFCFAVGLAVMMFVLCLNAVRYMPCLVRRKAKTVCNIGKMFAIITCLFVPGLLVLMFSLRGAGMMDYKKSIAVALLWIAGMIFSCVAGMREEQVC